MFKHVAGFPHYCVNEHGEVFSLRSNKQLSYSKTKHGYMSARFCENNIQKRRLLHRIVLSSFCGYSEARPHVNHKDLNIKNNSLPNLEWCTVSENMKHSFAHGRKPSKAFEGKFGNLHHNSINIVGYKDGNVVCEFESISLAREAGYILDFYKKRKNRIEGVTVCKGITFKKQTANA
jgi:hypothetical protein